MLRAAIFDLDGTLYDRDAALLRFAADQHHRFRLEGIGLTAEQYAARFAELDANGKVWKDKVFEILCEELPMGHDPDILLNDYKENYSSHCIVHEGAFELIEALVGKGVGLALISNGLTDFQLKVFESLGVDVYFNPVIVSEAAGFRKPDPRIFQLVLDAHEATPADAVFIGDDPTADIEGAHAVGMKTIWMRSSHHASAPYADGIAETFSDIGPHLSRLFETDLTG